MKENFYKALEENSIELMKEIPKSDLHNHAARGGKRSYVEECLDIKIPDFEGVFSSIDEMDKWVKEVLDASNVTGKMRYLRCVEAAFIAAKEDHVIHLSLNFGIGEVFAYGGIENFSKIIDFIKDTFAKEIHFYPVMAIYDQTGLPFLDQILSYGWFRGIDIINYQNRLSMKEMKAISRIGKKHKVRMKAHIGEYGIADNIIRYAEELMLDEIQHGILAGNSEYVTRRLADSDIVLNICPASNIKMGLCKDYKSHPIGVLYQNGVKVTVNTDDLLIYDSTVSEEYIKLYQNGILNKEELYDIYQTGIKTAELSR